MTLPESPDPYQYRTPKPRRLTPEEALSQTFGLRLVIVREVTEFDDPALPSTARLVVSAMTAGQIHLLHNALTTDPN